MSWISIRKKKLLILLYFPSLIEQYIFGIGIVVLTNYISIYWNWIESYLGFEFLLIITVSLYQINIQKILFFDSQHKNFYLMVYMIENTNRRQFFLLKILPFWFQSESKAHLISNGMKSHFKAKKIRIPIINETIFLFPKWFFYEYELDFH